MDDIFTNVVIIKNCMAILFIKDMKKIYWYLLMKPKDYYNIKTKIY